MTFALLLQPAAWAAILTVDGFDSTVADDGVCTLREAIASANTDAASGATAGECPAGDSGADTVELTGDVTLTLVDNSGNGLPVVDSEITVDGGGFTIERDAGAPAFRLFEVTSGGNLTLDSVVLQGGNASNGGAIYNGGGTLDVSDSVLTGNTATHGGAIANTSTLGETSTTTIAYSTLSGNSVGGQGSVFYNVSTSTNAADVASIAVNNSTLSGNTSTHTTVYSSATTAGAATFSMINSTVSGNSSSNGWGTIRSDNGTFTIESSTFVSNIGSILYPVSGTMTVTGTVFGNNTYRSCMAPLTDGGNNFTDNTALCPAGFVGLSTTDGVDLDHSLADHGGPTETHALPAGSLAIDAAGACATAADQRGAPRVGDCDSGAFEFGSSPPGPDPDLSVVALIPGAELETVDVDVDLTTYGSSVAAATFSIDYDESCLSFDDTDGDADNIPDDLAFNLPAGFAVTAFHDLGDTDGEIDVSIADLSPPIATLADDAILTITFTSTCSPAVSTTIVAPVAFSSDPAATFSDDLAVDVAGTTAAGSVEIWPGPRGDCNSTGALSAADLIADALEIFDGDGIFWADVVGSTYVGSPVGCDANDDTAVDAGDISCTILLIFGGSCGGGRGMLDAGGAFDPRTSPVLGLERGTLGKDGKLWIRVVFSAGSHGISSTAFSLNLMRGLRFDPFDGDGDGLPDSVRFPRGRPDLVDVRYDARDRRGEIDLTIGQFDGALADGVLLEIAVEPRRHLGTSRLLRAVRFSKAPAASFGDLFGRAVPGRAVNARRGR